MADELTKIIWVLTQVFFAVSTWMYILTAYWNGAEVPAPIWGVASALLLKFGIQWAGPSVMKAIRTIAGTQNASK